MPPSGGGAAKNLRNRSDRDLGDGLYPFGVGQVIGHLIQRVAFVFPFPRLLRGLLCLGGQRAGKNRRKGHDAKGNDIGHIVDLKGKIGLRKKPVKKQKGDHRGKDTAKIFLCEPSDQKHGKNIDHHHVGLVKAQMVEDRSHGRCDNEKQDHQSEIP